jgi:glycosyltransferase involved in cell wall biosynthesis
MSRNRNDQHVQFSSTIVCFSHLRWDLVFQRPQHLLTRAAQSYAVWYVEEPIRRGSKKPTMLLKMDSSGVRVATPILPEGIDQQFAIKAQRELLRELLDDVPNSTCIGWYYTPMALLFTENLTFDACVYDNMDELSTFAGAPPELVALEKALLARADVVFTGGQSLYEAKRSRHKNIYSFPSSVDVGHFAKARSAGATEPEDQQRIPKPRFGFFGVIDERMNLDLLQELAQIRPSWQFVMIGPVAKIDQRLLPRLPNIHWLGPKLYTELTNYLAGWDAGFMPFAINEATKFISPTKTPEFLAAGVPVVSTPIADVIRPYGLAGLVEIADDTKNFIAKLETLLTRPRQPWLKSVDGHLALGSWDTTWKNMDALIRRAVTPLSSSLATSAVEQASV